MENYYPIKYWAFQKRSTQGNIHSFASLQDDIVSIDNRRTRRFYLLFNQITRIAKNFPKDRRLSGTYQKIQTILRSLVTSYYSTDHTSWPRRRHSFHLLAIVSLWSIPQNGKFKIKRDNKCCLSERSS